MKHKFTFLSVVLLLLAFVTQPYQVVGQTRDEVIAYTLDGTQLGGTNNYASESEINQEGITWMVTGNTDISPWRIGGKNLDGVDRPLYSIDPMGDNITKIIVMHGAANNITVNSMTLIVSANADFTAPTSTLTADFVADADVTFERPANVNWSNQYFKIVYNVTVSGNSNRFIQFYGADFYKDDSGLPTVATPTFSPNSGVYSETQNVTISCTTAGATIHYTLDGTNPTTSSAVYSSPITISETTTVKAMAEKAGMENSSIATATYTIEQVTPITIAEARALANDEYALVQGVVTFIDGRNVYIQDATAGIDLFLNSNTVPNELATGDMVQAYGKRSQYNGLVELSGINGANPEEFSILSNGNTLPLAVKTIAEILEDYNGSNMLQSTRVKIQNATIGAINTSGNTPITQGESTMNIYKIPAVDGLLEGDDVTVTGVLGCFNAVQLRINSANDVEYTHPQMDVVATPTFSPAAGTYYEPKMVTISCETEGATIHYTTNGTTPTANSTVYTSAITVSVTTTIKAIAMKNGLTDSQIATATYTITDAPAGSDYTRITDLSQIGNGAQVILAARYNGNSNEYYAMTAQTSGKPDGVLFNSVPGTAGETLPGAIADEASVYSWTVTVDGSNYTFTNEAGDVLGYTTSTNFATGGDNTAWIIEPSTSETGAMVPEYSAFVITNANVSARAIALNSNYKFGPYAKSNMTSDTYNFFLDIFATAGTSTPVCATPTFNPAGGTYFESQSVTISCGTNGATIHYTTDGSTPTANSAVYSAPITVAETMTIKAIAMKEGYDNSGIAVADYTITIGAATIFSQDWENDMNGWTFVTVTGSKPWTIAQYSGNHYANANGYNGGANEQWCISPAFSLNTYSDVSLTFMNAMKFTGPDLQLFFSNDYDGTNPVAATWTELPFIKSEGNYVWTESGVIDLANFSGANCYIGFKYTSTETEAASWEIDDITLVGFTSGSYLTATPNALSGFTHIIGQGPSASQSFVLTAGNITPAGNIVMQVSGNGFEISLDNESFSNQVTINDITNLAPTTVYVRMNGTAVGQYSGAVNITSSANDEAIVTLSGNVVEQGESWNRIISLSDLHNGDQVIIAARYDATIGNGYYAMKAEVSGKPEGILFTSDNNGGVETLPASIAGDAETFLWNVTVSGNAITLTNAAGDALGYNSSTNFAGNESIEWNIANETSGEGALIPNYTGFVITNAETTNRGIAKNASNKFGAYATSNLNNADYNFYLDLFVQGGTATPTVSTPVFSMASGTYYEAFDVTITCATAGATIYYTTDGSTPTASSTVYSEPIHVDSDMTLKAIAMKEGFDNSGIATANYVIMDYVQVLFSQDWEGDMNGWTFVTVEGNKPWTIGQYSGNHYANANGYNDGANEQWCISPAFNLNTSSNVSLTFMNAMKFTGPDLQLFFSNNYDGSNPVAATWTELTFIKSEGNYVWTESGVISLAEFNGTNCYIGFKYTSTETEAASWEIDDIVLMGSTTEPYVNATPSSLSGFTHVIDQGPSTSKTFVLTAGNIVPAPGGSVGNILMQVNGNDFEISLDNETFTWQISLDNVTNLPPTTVYVRMNATTLGQHSSYVDIYASSGDEATVSLSGTVTEQGQGGAWTRIASLTDLHDGDQVIIASRYDATVGNGYYAMTAEVSGKPEGVLFTSDNSSGVETLPASIADNAETFLWNVTVSGNVITLTNAAGDALGYNSSTNFSGNESIEWNIAYETSGESAMVPNYTGFVITNAETANRGIAKNASNRFGAYSTSNLNNADYNFYQDLFVQGGTVVPTVSTPVFSVASGMYYEEFDVEISCATNGATIYYTTNGTNPTSSSTVYSNAIHVDHSMTIKAIAMKEGLDNSGIATANYVMMNDVQVILSQDWEGDMNGWTFVTVEGNKPWIIGNYDGNQYANANGYNDNVNNIQWCISPAMNLTQYAGQFVMLTFMNAKNYNGPDLEVFVSNDYDGRDPESASWEPLSFNMSSGGYEWVESGAISLNGIIGDNCFIGFRYFSTPSKGAAAWEIDDIMVTVAMGNNPYLIATPNVLSGFQQFVNEGPSDVKTLVVSGGNLLNTEVALAVNNIYNEGFEISLDGVSYTNSVTLAAENGVLAPTNVYVRLNGTQMGSVNSQVNISCGDATAIVNLSGSLLDMTELGEMLAEFVDIWNRGNAFMIENNSGTDLQMLVYNLLGQPVMSGTVAAGSIEMPHHLANGLYIVTLQCGTGMMSAKIVVR